MKQILKGFSTIRLTFDLWRYHAHPRVRGAALKEVIFGLMNDPSYIDFEEEAAAARQERNHVLTQSNPTPL